MNAAVEVRLAGATVDWLRWNTSWGNAPGETALSTRTREKVLAAPERRVGKGTQARVVLAADEADDLAGILDSIAGAGETMTTEERGGDAYAYRVMRRDADRIREQLRDHADDPTRPTAI